MVISLHEEGLEQEITHYSKKSSAVMLGHFIITCQSKNVLYWQKCLWCPRTPETSTRKTINFREWQNNHISACRLGGSTDKFDNHVYEYRKKYCTGNEGSEPYFQLFAFFPVKDASTLESYERHLHILGLDTMNAPK